MGPIKALVSFVGRFFLAAIFLASAVTNHIPNTKTIIADLEVKQVPQPTVAHYVSIAVMLVGGVSVLLGFQGRIGALLLALFICAATYYYHDFWNLVQDDPQREAQMTNFMKNVAILGGLLFILANGSGAGAVDRQRITIDV
jgi:putative oxidoreductase